MNNPIYFYDTIGVSYRIEIPQEELETWDKKNRGETYERQYVFADNESLYASYHPYSYGSDPRPMLSIYLSLPKIIFGCNHKMLNNNYFQGAIYKANNLIKSIPVFSIVENVENAPLVRFDVANNFIVGENIDEYLTAAKNSHGYPRRKKHIYDHGVNFRSKRETVTVYDKIAECGHTEADGMLRLEVSIKGSSQVSKILGKSKPTILDVTPDIQNELLRTPLKNLHLNDRVICSQTEMEHRIYGFPGITKVISRNLLNYVREKMRNPLRDLSEIYSPPTIRKYDKLLERIGISDYLTDSIICLEPLKL